MGETALFQSMFHEVLLNASDVCSNCFHRQRRDAIRTRQHKPDKTYSERLRWQTTVEDVPGPVVHEAGTLFCACGADGAHTRIWETDDVDRERLAELAKATCRTLRAKGHRVDARRLGRTASEAFDRLPDTDEFGPYRESRPQTIDAVLARAVDAAVLPAPEDGATAPTPA